jgi:hypothetical protein
MVYTIKIFVVGEKKAYVESKIDEDTKISIESKLENPDVNFISFGTVILNKRYIKSVVIEELH